MNASYYTTTEVAEMFKVTTETVRDWISAKKLQAVQINRQWRVTDDAIRAFVNDGGKR